MSAEDFGKWLRGWRMTMGVQVRELSRVSGVSVATIQKVERGKPVFEYSTARVVNALELIESERGQP